MKQILLVLLLAFFVSFNTYSQTQNTDESEEAKKITNNIAAATNFSIPSSPAFVLLDVNPSKVNTPGSIRDFKLDWIFKGDSLAPDIAIEFQPIWLLGYKNINLQTYQDKLSWMKRILSTLNVSLGTAKKDGIQSLAYSLKITLINKADPLMNKSFIAQIKPIISDIEKEILLVRGRVEAQLEADKSKLLLTDKQKLEYAEKIKYYDSKIDDIDKIEDDQLKNKIEEFEKENWNAAKLEVGFGQIFNYTGESLQNLDFEGSGYGIWVNGCKGIGKTSLISGLFKYIRLNQQDQFFGGVNFRYGGSRLNFFIEGIYERVMGVDKNTIAYGGHYRVNSDLLVEFGLRTEYNKNMKFKDLKPIVKFCWVTKK